MRNKTLKVPVEMFQYALREKFIAPFRLYLFLKASCDGKTMLTGEEIGNIAGKLGYKSTKTIDSNINKLLNDGWITHSRRSGLHFVKGFELVRREKDFLRVSAAEIHVNELGQLREFATAVVITSLINSQKRKRKPEAAAYILHKGSSLYASKPKRASFFPISTHVIAKVLNCSVMQASRLRKGAVRAGYLEMRKPPLIDTGLNIRGYKLFTRHVEVKKKLRVKNNRVFCQGCFLIRSNIKFRSRVNIFSPEHRPGHFECPASLQEKIKESVI